MKNAESVQTMVAYPERRSSVPANGILLALLTLGMVGLYSGHRFLSGRQILSTAETVAAPSVDKMPAASLETEKLGKSEWQSITSQMAEADRAFVQPPGTPETFRAFNRSRNLAFTVSAEAVEVRPRMGVPTPDGQEPSADSDW